MVLPCPNRLSCYSYLLPFYHKLLFNLYVTMKPYLPLKPILYLVLLKSLQASEEILHMLLLHYTFQNGGQKMEKGLIKYIIMNFGGWLFSARRGKMSNNTSNNIQIRRNRMSRKNVFNSGQKRKVFSA